ncbi:LOW QUALITY PROTEIN: protein STRUBBELIG-RECEPTOR FAMILY 3-like [Primulina tabacum]|uniref:LOW QUALITY PROTEIN: protein STRUBBELIG-RECEPTOR FAMILY 3-like n=1 Tax=Primulina tabacum TaxID=48773 RepID=UPI003F5A69C2
MGGNKSGVSCLGLEILLGFTLVCAIRMCFGYTNPNDVAAINSLYVSLGSPSVPGWVATGGDPCAQPWQGVGCDITNSFIISIKLIGANLGGELGDNLGAFSSIQDIELSNNLIGGSIPNSLPDTLVTFFLSDNKLTGNIPSSVSSLSKLSAMSLNNNELTGEIPDAFEGLTLLVNLDFSSNNLSGELPPSMGNLSALTTLHLQNNQLSGTLDVLQDPPLRDLDIRNNLFSGPIPEKVSSIPNFRKDGNLFNINIAPLSPPIASGPPAPPFFPGPTSDKTPPTPNRSPSASGQRPGKQADGPSNSKESNFQNSKKSLGTKRIVWISIASVLSFIIILLAALLFVPRCLRERRETYRTPKQREVTPYTGARENPQDGGLVIQPRNDEEKASPVVLVRPKEENKPRAFGSIPKPRGDEEEVNKKQMGGVPRKNYHEIDLSGFDLDVMPPPPPPPPPTPPPPPPQPFPPQKVIVNPIAAVEALAEKPLRLPATSVKAYTIASLQQYTNSFSQENLIGVGMLGNVYRADLPDGKLLAIKKLDKRVTNQQKDDQFIELVNNLDKIRHANVVELMGYCAEHGQRLLIYEYCTFGTLQDALHSDDEFKKKLSWNTRIRMALGAARALEYLHEVCEPPVIHRNFKSANVLLDDELSVRVSDCGLAPLISSGVVSQLSGQLLTTYGYGAPEFESGIYTSKSDVYSFGVVMLELLTGRMSYDRTRTRGDQFLVRWAIPQLHDIDALSRMVDPALSGNYPVKSLSHFADIISRCVQTEPEYRPPMSEVVHDLIQMIRKESPGSSSDGD